MAPTSSRSRGQVARGASLYGADVLGFARHGGLRGVDAVGGEQLDQLRLARHGVLLEQPGDAVLALLLRHARRAVAARSGAHVAFTSRSQESRPRKECIRLWACLKMRLLGPSATDAATSSPRCAGRQCMNTAPAAAASMIRSSTWKPSNARLRASASASKPIDVKMSVCTASAPLAASSGRVKTSGTVS